MRSYWRPGAVGLLVAVLYGDVLYSLASDWWNDDSYSHGFLAAAIAGWIAWRQRRSTLAVPAAGSSSGLWLTGFSVFLYMLGRLGSEFYTTRISFIFLLCGLVWSFWGLARLRRIAFPLLLLASVIPPPVIVYNKVSAPLQLLASQLGTYLTQGFGASVYRDGNVIQLANASLGVAEACSGLRSLAALTVGALLLGFVEQLRMSVRVFALLLAIPIAVLFNILRVAGTALLAERNPEWAMGYYHTFSGWLVFVAGFGTLFVSVKLLHFLFNRKSIE